MVTGGAGFIGSHLVDSLIKQNPNRLVIVDNFFLGNERNIVSAQNTFSDLEVIRIDASNLSAMIDVINRYKIEMVYDLATIPLPTSLSYPEFTIQTNVGITSCLCEILRRQEFDYLLHLSSSEAYGSAKYIPMDEIHPHQASTPYAASKSAEDLIIESYIRTFDIKASIVRPFNNFGPRQNPGSYAGIIPIIINQVLTEQPIYIFGDGEQTRDFSFVTETAEAIIEISKNVSCLQQTINVATGIETSINKLVSLMLEVLEKPNHSVIYQPPRPGDVRRHCADVSKLKEYTGLSLNSMNINMISETIDWYRGMT